MFVQSEAPKRPGQSALTGYLPANGINPKGINRM